MSVVNGQPPHMIAAQKVITTDTIAHMASIGVGGLIAPPIVPWVTAVTMTATTKVVAVSISPLTGCTCPSAKLGLLPHVTAVTIWIGIAQSRK